MSEGKGIYNIVRGFDERMYTYYVTPGLEQDKRKFSPMNDFDMAHVIMLAEQKIIQREEARKILKALQEIEKIGVDSFPFDSKLDIFTNRESYLMKVVGESIGGKVHTGRSRSDVAGVADRMITRDDLLSAMESLLGLIDTSLNLAADNDETVMPSYTQLQHAQPTTFAHYLLSFIYPFLRDFERFETAYLRTNISPAGAAILGGTSFPLNRERIAELLGFSGLCMNTRDATMNYDYMLDGFYAASTVMCNMARLVDDLDIWCSSEFKMIDLASQFCGTSSIMPQKRNPYPLQVIRGESGVMFGQFMGAFGVLKAPSDEVMDFFLVPVSLHKGLKSCKGMVELLEGVLSTLILYKETMKERAAIYWTQATDLADNIVREKGLDFRTTHHIVARLVKMTMEANKLPQDVNMEMLDTAAKEIIGGPLNLSEKALREALDPMEGVRGRKVPGGTAPERAREQISQCREALIANQDRLKTYEERLQEARGKMQMATKDMMRED